MTERPCPDFRTELDRQSARFRTALAGCDESASVPGCPDWSTEDLLAHLTEVQAFWAHVVGTPITEGPQLETYDDPPRANGPAAMFEAFDAAHRALTSALDGAAATDRRWMWTADEALHTVGYITRRQAHEALIHRVDAEQAAAQQVSDTEAAFAADGIDEMLTVMLGSYPEWTTFTGDGRVVRFAATDTGREWFVELGHLTGEQPGTGARVDEASLRMTGPVDPIATISGPAWPLDLWLWNRADASALDRTGDSGALEHIDNAIAEGLN